MREMLILATENAIVVIDWLALILIVIGTIETFVRGLVVMFSSATGHEQRDLWLRYARWLVAALTFQLGADIAETAIRENWEAVGRIAAVAVIRTFLNYFLERDVAEIRALEQGGEPGKPAP